MTNSDKNRKFALVLFPLSCSSEDFTLSLRSIKRAVAGPDNSMFKFYKARSNALNTSHIASLPVRSRNWQIICSGKIQNPKFKIQNPKSLTPPTSLHCPCGRAIGKSSALGKSKSHGTTLSENSKTILRTDSLCRV